MVAKAGNKQARLAAMSESAPAPFPAPTPAPAPPQVSAKLNSTTISTIPLSSSQTLIFQLLDSYPSVADLIAAQVARQSAKPQSPTPVRFAKLVNKAQDELRVGYYRGDGYSEAYRIEENIEDMVKSIMKSCESSDSGLTRLAAFTSLQEIAWAVTDCDDEDIRELLVTSRLSDTLEEALLSVLESLDGNGELDMLKVDPDLMGWARGLNGASSYQGMYAESIPDEEKPFAELEAKLVELVVDRKPPAKTPSSTISAADIASLSLDTSHTILLCILGAYPQSADLIRPHLPPPPPPIVKAKAARPPKHDPWRYDPYSRDNESDSEDVDDYDEVGRRYDADSDEEEEESDAESEAQDFSSHVGGICGTSANPKTAEVINKDVEAATAAILEACKAHTGYATRLAAFNTLLDMAEDILQAVRDKQLRQAILEKQVQGEIESCMETVWELLEEEEEEQRLQGEGIIGRVEGLMEGYGNLNEDAFSEIRTILSYDSNGFCRW